MIFDDIEELEMLGYGNMFAPTLGINGKELAEIERWVRIQVINPRDSEEARQYNRAYYLKHRVLKPRKAGQPQSVHNRNYYLKNKAKIAARRKEKWRADRANVTPKKRGRPYK